MNIKKILALTLSLSLAFSMASCDSSNSSSSEEQAAETTAVESTENTTGNDETSTEAEESGTVYKDLKDGVIMQIGGFDVTEDEYRYYFDYAKNVMSGGDNTYWDNDTDSSKLTSLKNQTLDYIFNSYTVYKIAADNNVELDDTDNEKVNISYQKDKTYYEATNAESELTFDEYMKTISCTEELYKSSIARMVLEYKVIASLYESDFKSNYINNYVNVKFIQLPLNFSYKMDENNEATDVPEDVFTIKDSLSYSDEEKELIKKINSLAAEKDSTGVSEGISELMALIRQMIYDGESFDSFIDKYNISEYMYRDELTNEYLPVLVNEDVMPEDFMEVALSLSAGDITTEDVQVTGYGNMIILRESTDDVDSDSLISAYMSNSNYSYAENYSQLCYQAQKDMDIVFDNSYDDITVNF